MVNSPVPALVSEGCCSNLDQFISKLPEEEKFIPMGEIIQSYTVAEQTYQVYKVQYMQWRSQPGDSVPLCKYSHDYKLSTQSISKEMNNDNELKFAERDQIVGLATPLRICAFYSVHGRFNVFMSNITIRFDCDH
jgi:hypothetical protein